VVAGQGSPRGLEFSSVGGEAKQLGVKEGRAVVMADDDTRSN
jgi:hypothetical protein